MTEFVDATITLSWPVAFAIVGLGVCIAWIVTR